jgi:hypothetical protein
MTTPPEREVIEEILQDFESRYSYLYQGTVYENGGGNFSPVHESVKHWLRTTLHQELQKVREEERDKILRNILKWSDTATVMETTGKEGAKRATKKLREHLYGSYHFLYQALRIDQSELDQPNK